MADGPQVAPSILSADFGALAAQVGVVVEAGARVVHCDVMDGHFVPPITFGPLVVGGLREALGDGVDLDVHLMIDAPERHVAEFARAGASGITFHAEATAHVDYVLNLVREAGCRAGLAVNPATPPAVLGQARPDLALVMTVNPGWGGQPFIAGQLEKVRAVRGMLGDGVAIEVDGGINTATAAQAARAGADWFVAGSAIFGTADPAAAYAEIALAAHGYA